MRAVKYLNKSKEHAGYFHCFTILSSTDGVERLSCIIEDAETGNVHVFPYKNVIFIDHSVYPRECKVDGKDGYTFHEFVRLNKEAYGIVETEGRINCVIPIRIQFKRRIE